MKWDIRLEGAGRRRDPIDRLKTDLEELEVFVREVLQNSLDAQLNQSEPVQVRFRLDLLEGQRKRNFLEAVLAPIYLREMKEAHRTEVYLAEQNRSGRRPSPEITEKAIDMFDPDSGEPLPLMYVDDRRTTGLTGVEFDYGQASRFCACCRDTEFSVKKDKRSGGSYGKGKNTLWRHARTRLVLFYSDLSDPFEGETSRFLGVGNLPWHATEIDSGDRKSGRCYFGRDKEGRSILGGPAVDIASRLGLYWPERETGTTICLVGFDPRLGEVGEGSDLGAKLNHITETWYWPALVSSRMEVSITNLTSGEGYSANPVTREDLEPYISCWNACAGLVPEEQNIPVVDEVLEVPEGPNDEPLTPAHYSVGIQTLPEKIPPVGPPENRVPGSECVALVRGFGMVVEYKQLSVHRLTAEPYAGVCRAGLAYPDRQKTEVQERLEQLLSTAEPEAHDCWRASEIDAGSWRAAKARIKDLLKRIQEIVDGEAVSPEQERRGSTVPELSRRFRFKGDKGPSPRSSRISLQRRDMPRRSNGKVVFPISISGLGEPLPSTGQLELRISAGLVDSAAGPSTKAEPIPVESVVINGQLVDLEWTDRAGTKIRSVIELGQREEPLEVDVVATLAKNLDFELAHYLLDARGRILGGEE